MAVRGLELHAADHGADLRRRLAAGRTDLAHVQKNVQIAQYEKAIQSGFREVADALAGRGTLDEQIQAQRLLVDASQRAYDVSDQRFRQGIDNYLSVLDSQRSLQRPAVSGGHAPRAPVQPGEPVRRWAAAGPSAPPRRRARRNRRKPPAADPRDGGRPGRLAAKATGRPRGGAGPFSCAPEQAGQGAASGAFLAMRPTTKSTMMAPTTEAIQPAGSPSWYQPS